MERTTEMTAFQFWGGYPLRSTELPGSIILGGRPDVTPLHNVQKEFRRIFVALVVKADFYIPKLVVELTYWYESKHPLVKFVLPYDAQDDEANRFALSVFALMLLLDDYGPSIKSCPAPKLRSRKGEVCGRWFVGRPNQTYCSPLCQNRATTRASRQKQRRPTQKKKG